MAITTTEHAFETVLSHVGTPPAQTWNYLHVDDIALTVPSAPDTATATAPDDEVACVELASGDEATAWLDAMARDRVRVEVPAGARRDSPVLVDVSAATGDVCATDVIVREGAEATVVVTVASNATGEESRPTATCGNILRIIAGKDARVSLLTIVAAGDDVTCLDDTGVRLGDGARLDARQYVLGAGTCAMGFSCDLAGTGSSLSLSTRYLVRDCELLDMNHVVRQRGRKSTSSMDFSGVLSDGASKTLRATIDLVRGCKGARGRENETVLVTGDDVVNKTLPVILCDEDDVAGDHGATIGSASPEQLDYLATRGLSETESERLFVRTAFDDALIHSPAGPARTAVLGLAAHVLGADEAAELSDPSGLLAGERTDA